MNSSGMVLFFTAFILGLRHGFDLDHISIIDAITRTTRSHRGISRAAGVLFSSGHGLIVMIASLIIGSGIMQSRLPAWLEPCGAIISIFFLFVFGMATLWSVLRAPQPGLPSGGLKTWFFTRLIGQKRHPVYIMAVGALFAFSFDTLSQAALFAISASMASGWLFSGILGLVFTIGMMCSDGVNGYVVSMLINRVDKTSLILSRLLGLLISIFSLAVGAFNLSRLI